MGVRITGLDELTRKLQNLSDQAEALHGGHTLPISELLSPSFLATCTLFNSADEMFEKSGFKIESQADFEAIPDDQWDDFIRGNTSFPSWKEMLQAAGAAWARNKLNWE